MDSNVSQRDSNLTGVREAQAAQRRDQLLQVGFEFFSQRGYRGTTVRDVTRAAGVTEAVLYHYFGNKAELFTAVFERYAPVAPYREIGDATLSLPISEALRRLGREYLRLVRERRPFVTTLLSEAPVEPELAQLLSRFLDGVLDDISQLLAERQDRGEVDPDVDLVAAARAFQGGLTLHVLATAFQPDADRADFDDEAIVDGLVDLLLTGLAPSNNDPNKEKENTM